VASDGTLYLAGIDAPHGLWVSSSDDNGQTFQPPQSVAPLLGNPSAGCAQTAQQPLPREARACQGPDPTLLVTGDKLVIVYSDFNQNQTSDVFAVGIDFTTGLRPAVVASGGVAHAFWGDSRNYTNGEDVETASIPENRAFASR